MYERILFVIDRLPSGLPDVPDRRRSQLLSEVRMLWPAAQATVVTLEDHESDRRLWTQGHGIEVVAPPVDLEAWLDARPFEFTLVIFCGRATMRLAAQVRAAQPQAFFVMDLQAEEVDSRADFNPTLRVPEERLGERLLRELEQQALEEAIATCDAVLGESSVRGFAAHVGAKSYVFDGVPMPTAPAGLEGRDGAVLAARFAEEFGEPDEAGIVLLLGAWRAAEADVLGRIRFCLRRPPPALRRRVTARAPLATGALVDEAVGARVLVTVRPFGASTGWLRQVALDTATPWVLLGHGAMREAIHVADASELRRTVARLLHDDDAWTAAHHRLVVLREQSNPRIRRAGLVALFGAAGFVPPSDAALEAPPAPLRVPEPFSVLVDEAGAFQGQIQTLGWSERRPMDPVRQRADVGLDYLFPQHSYAWWYEAHSLSPEAVDEMRRLSASFALQPLISIVMPVYNTDPDVLDAAIASVRAQVYRHWELCIADDASTSPATAEVLDRHADEDPRIKVQRLAHNGGIVEASNAAASWATGEFLGLLDHDDLLTPDALFEVVALLNRHPDLDFVYSDEDKLDERGSISTPFFKPSWSPEIHLCVNYVTHFAVYRRSVFEQVGGFRPGFDGSQDYDLSLRVTEATDRIGHIAKPIYTWRMVSGSAAVRHDAKPYAIEAAHRAVREALHRRGYGDKVDKGTVPGTWRARYPIVGSPKVSVLIPTRNGRDMLQRCIDGVLHHTAFDSLELVVVDNASDDPATLDYLASLDAKVVRYPYRFNYARQMNLAAALATGELLLFLNNDMEVLRPGWLDAMVEHGQRPEVGAVGARLIFPSGRLQHEGVFVGYGGGCAGNVDTGGYFGLGQMVRDCTSVTAACMLIRPTVFADVGGFDERLRVAFNDVDLCLRLRQRGYRIVYTPYAELVHAESASRGGLHPEEDEAFFVRRWGGPDELVDPFYNPNLDPVRPFRLKR